jgi:hypothetical protein
LSAIFPFLGSQIQELAHLCTLLAVTTTPSSLELNADGVLPTPGAGASVADTSDAAVAALLDGRHLPKGPSQLAIIIFLFKIFQRD